MSNTALITGCGGQDGSYLAELLVSKGYTVFGLYRRTSTSNKSRIDSLDIKNQIEWLEGDVTDPHSLDRAVAFCKPDEVYHLAAQTFVGTSWTQPNLTAQVTAIGTLNMLEAVRKHAPNARFYQASSSEQFGKAEPPQNENTNFAPRSPYGCAKCFAHNITVNYRESYGMHTSCGILFNHESSRRGLEFVTRKITHSVAQIHLGQLDKLRMGSLSPMRDWGHAKDYVYAMWLMLQQDIPDDYVISRGYSHSVEDFVQFAFEVVGLDWNDFYEFDPKFSRPAEVTCLLGNSRKAQVKLGWTPKIGFRDLIQEMVEEDLKGALSDSRATAAL